MEQYSNREIDEMKDDIFKALARIEEQTIKTNGSVAEIKIWKEQTKGIMKASIFFISILFIPLIAWGLWQIVQIGSKITGVETTLQSYDKIIIQNE